MLRKNSSWSVVLLLICGALLTLPSSAQHFQQVTGTLVSVAAGRNEVFGLDSHGAIWRYDARTKSFGRIRGSLQQIAVGGGTLSQPDEIWGISRGEVYRFNYTTEAFDHISAPSFSQISVGEGAAQNLFSSSLNPDKCYPYEVWGVGPSDGNAQFARYNFCENTFNSGFVFNGPFTQGATGGGDIWVLNKQDAPFHFVDSESELSIANLPLTQIAVGVNDVWGLNSSNQIFRYDPNTNQFVQVGGILRQIAAGGDGVWGIDLIGEIFRWDPSSLSWVQVDGVLKSIAVGSGAGVWGVNDSDQVFTFVRP
jgi:hypothetical protein